MKPVLAGAMLGIAACCLRLAPAGGVEAQPSVVHVDNGLNRLSLDGIDLVVLRARRENYNAHSFDVVAFYSGNWKGVQPGLNIVPLFGNDRGNQKEQHEITVGGGADCKLNDFRLIKARGRQPARLVLANRDFGDSDVSPGIVHFIYYDLMQNGEELPGVPPLYFQSRRKADSRQKYCDVNDAFDRELHMGRSSGIEL